MTLHAGEVPKTSPESRLSASRLAEVPSPRRIVSINLCTDELLLQLVEPGRVSAVSVHCADPAISSVSREARQVMKIKGGIEDVLAVRPDLLLGGTFSNRETLRFFRDSKIPVLVFSVPKNFEDIYADIRRLAQSVGEPAKGEAMIRRMQDELAGLQKGKKGSDPFKNRADPFKNRAVFFQSGNYVPGAATFENAVMEAAGLTNVAVELGIKGYGNLSLEKLIGARPGVLIFSSDQKSGRTVRGEVLDHPAIKKGLPGVKIVKLPASLLTCGSPASVEAVKILVRETGP